MIGNSWLAGALIIDVLTFALVVLAQNDIAARAFLRELAWRGDEAYASAVVFKGIALADGLAVLRGRPAVGREWVGGLW